MKKSKNKKNILEIKKKENERFLQKAKKNQKYEIFSKAIIRKKEQLRKEQLQVGNKKEGKPQQEISLNASEDTYICKDINLIKKNIFNKVFDLIVHKIDSIKEPKQLYHNNILYCSFQIASGSFNKSKNVSIDVPNSLYSNVVLVVDSNHHEWQKEIIKQKLTFFKKVISFDKLQKLHNATEKSLQEFMTQHDFFVFDKNIKMEKCSSIIAKIKNKSKSVQRISLNLETFSIDSKEIINKTYMTLKKGTCHAIPCGYISQNKEEVFENIQSIEKYMLQLYKKTHTSIKSISLHYLDMYVPMFVNE